MLCHKLCFTTIRFVRLHKSGQHLIGMLLVASVTTKEFRRIVLDPFKKESLYDIVKIHVQLLPIFLITRSSSMFFP